MDNSKMKHAMMDVKSFRNTLISIDLAFEKLKKQQALSETENNDLKMILDLQHTVKRIEAVLHVYARDGNIHSGYASEKLQSAKGVIAIVERYFTKKV